MKFPVQPDKCYRCKQNTQEVTTGVKKRIRTPFQLVRSVFYVGYAVHHLFFIYYIYTLLYPLGSRWLTFYVFPSYDFCLWTSRENPSVFRPSSGTRCLGHLRGSQESTFLEISLRAFPTLAVSLPFVHGLLLC